MTNQEWTWAVQDMDTKIKRIQVQMISDQKRKGAQARIHREFSERPNIRPKQSRPLAPHGTREPISGPVLPGNQFMDGRPRRAGHVILGFLRVSQEAGDLTSTSKATTYQPIIIISD